MNEGTLPASGPSGIGVGGVAAEAGGASVNATQTTARNDRLIEPATGTKAPSTLVSPWA
jgi:hypothetical protein